MTRRSTTGGVVMFGSHCLKTYSSTEDIIALSSGEAEFLRIVRAGGHGSVPGLGIKSFFEDQRGFQRRQEHRFKKGSRKGPA